MNCHVPVITRLWKLSQGEGGRWVLVLATVNGKFCHANPSQNNATLSLTATGRSTDTELFTAPMFVSLGKMSAFNTYDL